jgi:hypothetical protein
METGRSIPPQGVVLIFFLLPICSTVPETHSEKLARLMHLSEAPYSKKVLRSARA